MDEQAVFHALADPTRRELVRMLAQGDRPVHVLSDAFAISRPAISRHLRILRQSGAVSERRVGRENVYALNPKVLKTVRDWADVMAQYWSGRLSKLQSLAILSDAELATDNEDNP